MNILNTLKARFHDALSTMVDDTAPLLEMVKPTQSPEFGDFQANCAMPLKKVLGESDARQIAAQIVAKLDVADICDPPEVAGPGFINLKLKESLLLEQLEAARKDARLGVSAVDNPRTYVIDYSSPNVAKPMHVGHIRSTVIGDALARTLRFLGHKVITDNHVGDWGTQFGMIIYGYKHFVNDEAFAQAPVAELSRLYKFVSRIIAFHKGHQQLPKLQEEIETLAAKIEAAEAQEPTGDKKADKKAAKQLKSLQAKHNEVSKEANELARKLSELEREADTFNTAMQHQDIATAVLQETAKLHEGDPENMKLWHDFLPNCRDEIQRVYKRLDITFDHEHGESFYHDKLAGVVEKLKQKDLATNSDGAVCVFLPEQFETPMIVQKSDGAYLYATTDLATIDYRMETWQPDAILYVVDHRQSEHFEKLFAVAKLLGCEDVELKHVSFGTVLDEKKRPFKTREGAAAGLEYLLDEAVAAALKVAAENDENRQDDQLQSTAEAIGHGAIKYADLSHNRTSDYVFSLKKMVALQGNTGAYMQYSYARIRSISAKAQVDIEALRSSDAAIQITSPYERALAVQLIAFEAALHDVIADYRPNQLTNYLYELAKHFSGFFENCHVIKAESEELRNSRLLLCDLTARVLKQGLQLLGIAVVDKM